MLPLSERYAVDEKGDRNAVILDIDDYRRRIDELEAPEAIRAYDSAKASGDEAVTFEAALAEIERERR